MCTCVHAYVCVCWGYVLLLANTVSPFSKVSMIAKWTDQYNSVLKVKLEYQCIQNILTVSAFY